MLLNVKTDCSTSLKNGDTIVSEKQRRAQSMSKNQINFARNLRILRDMNEMSQQDLADQIHVARQTVSTWELGDSLR